MTVSLVPLEQLTPAPWNPRHIDKARLKNLAESIKIDPNFLLRRPILAQLSGEIYAGNQRWHAAKLLFSQGWTPPWQTQTVPVDLDDVPDQLARERALRDNNAWGAWDDDSLARLLGDLRDSGSDTGLLGFDDRELSQLLARLGDGRELNPDDADLTPPVDPITKPGDLWILGDHRLLCGDCRNDVCVATVLDGASIHLAMTSPPYARQRDYDPESGFEGIPPHGYVEWFSPVASTVARSLAEDGSWIVNIKPNADGLDTELYVLDLVLAHVRQWGWHFATEFCWERTGVPKQATQRLKNQFEPCYQFSRGRWKFRPHHVMHESDDMIVPVGIGGGDTSWDRRQGSTAFFTPGQVRPRRNGTTGTMSDVQGTNAAPVQALRSGWAYPGNRLPSFAGSHDALGHPAAFPVGLPEFFIQLFTDEQDTVYDPFVGSGSTLIAAERARRRGYGIEISPGYCDVIVRRWERVSGKQAQRV
jgi:DNA modification methylase